jgi:hypothetical protein
MAVLPSLYHDFQVRLTCGCSIRLRNNPLHAGVRFGCPAGLGHGYRLGWTSWTNTATGQTVTNPATSTCTEA